MKNPRLVYFIIGFCTCAIILLTLFFRSNSKPYDTRGIYLGRIQIIKQELIESEKIKAELRLQIKLGKDSIKLYQDSSFKSIKYHTHEINRILRLNADDAIAFSAKYLSVQSGH